MRLRKSKREGPTVSQSILFIQHLLAMKIERERERDSEMGSFPKRERGVDLERERERDGLFCIRRDGLVLRTYILLET